MANEGSWDRIVVPLDGSALAERALGPAAALAARLGAAVELLTIRWPATSVATCRAYLDTRAFALTQLPAPADVRVVTEGDAPDVIAGAAVPGSLVCMATHGRGGVARAALGSVAEAVLGRATRPILLVGPEAELTPEVLALPLVVLCTDGSERSRTAVEPAYELARAIGAAVRVVQVVTAPEVVAFHRGTSEQRAALEAVVARLAEAGVTADLEVPQGPDAAEAILAVAASGGIAALVLATHGRTGLARVALGSVAARVVRAAPCPVLAVPPGYPTAGPRA